MAKLICQCYALSDEEIAEAINRRAAKTVDEIQSATGAGGACGACRRDLSGMLSEFQDKTKETLDEPGDGYHG